MNTTQVLELISAYENETNWTVWNDLSSNILQLATVLRDTETYPLLCNFVRKLYQRAFSRLGWQPLPTDDHCSSMLRARLLSVLGAMGDETTIVEACKRVHALNSVAVAEKQTVNLTSQHSIQQQNIEHQSHAILSPDLRDTAYAMVVENGDRYAYEMVLQLYHTAGLREEKIRYGKALGFSKNIDLLKRTLTWSLSEEVRVEDAPDIFMAVAENPLGIEAVRSMSFSVVCLLALYSFTCVRCSVARLGK